MERRDVWNKQKEETASPQQSQNLREIAPQRPIPQAASALAQMPAPPQPTVRAAAASAAIGPSMYIKGEIRLREELLVDGDVEGHLESESVLTVGPNGKVRANIKAREVVIFGSVRGDVEVTEKIAIRGQGSLIGNIKSAGISIDDGAYFKGSVDIIKSAAGARTS